MGLGPLTGIRILEVGGIGPAPMCGMLLADMGAEVIVVQRKRIGSLLSDTLSSSESAIFNRGKKSIALDLQSPEGVQVVLDLIAHCDALIEGFRPGVMERLGLSPEVCLQRNPKLLFGRVTGWGQFGPLSQAAGHDINYIALTGALYHSGHKTEAPFAPPTLVGDVGGGAMFLAMGILAGIVNVRTTGQGQVIDAAITDGSAVMCSLLQSLNQMGGWSNARGENMLDSGSHWYECYQCADGKYVTVGAVEPKFYAELIELCGLDHDPVFAAQNDGDGWLEAKHKMAEMFRSKSQAEWCQVLEGTDACFAPVLSLDEAPSHPHNIARGTYVNIGGVTQAAPAPKFSVSSSEVASPPPRHGGDSWEVLSAVGYSGHKIDELIASGVIHQPSS